MVLFWQYQFEWNFKVLLREYQSLQRAGFRKVALAKAEIYKRKVVVFYWSYPAYMQVSKDETPVVITPTIDGKSLKEGREIVASTNKSFAVRIP